MFSTKDRFSKYACADSSSITGISPFFLAENVTSREKNVADVSITDEGVVMRVLHDIPDDENGDVLRRMQEGGDDLAVPRDIDFSVVFPDERSSEEFADHFRRSGFKVSVEEWDRKRERPWDVTVTRYMLPDHPGITDICRRV